MVDPLLNRMEKENVFLRDQLRAKDQQIESLLSHITGLIDLRDAVSEDGRIYYTPTPSEQKAMDQSIEEIKKGNFQPYSEIRDELSASGDQE